MNPAASTARKKATTPTKAKELVTCMDCKLAYLMQSHPHNPIVAECETTHKRNVASSRMQCANWKQGDPNPEIHAMIPAKRY